MVAFDGHALTADGRRAACAARCSPSRSAGSSPTTLADVSVAFAGRGGIIERLSIVRGDQHGALRARRVRRRDVAGAGSRRRHARRAATTDPRRASAAGRAASRSRGRRSAAPMPPASPTDKARSPNGTRLAAPISSWKTPIPGLATSSPIVWGDRVIVATAASDEDTSFRTGLVRRRQAGRQPAGAQLPRLRARSRHRQDRVATGGVQGTRR